MRTSFERRPERALYGARSCAEARGAAGRLEGDRAARITIGLQLRLEFVAPFDHKALLRLDFEDLAGVGGPTVGKHQSPRRTGLPIGLVMQVVSGGWPRILSNLKSLLETGEIILKS